MKKFKDWTIKDSFPKEKLEDIQPFSLRAFALINRKKNQFDESYGSVELLGALNILESLDYHFENFVRLKDSDGSKNRIHEVVAYLNRIGQFYYFIKSDFTKNIISNPILLTPKINMLKVFRMKNTAHRSIDFPKDETTSYRSRQALTFIGFQTNYNLDKEVFTLPTENGDSTTKWNYFTPEIDHPIVMKEAYDLIYHIVQNIIQHNIQSDIE